MYRYETLRTVLLLARGIPPKDLAEALGVTLHTLHQRRRRFDKYVGGITPRIGKRGRPKMAA